AAHPVIADLQRALALVRHVAVGAGHTRARVDALAPRLELGVLRLENARARLGMLPVVEGRAVVEAEAVVVSLDLLDAEAVRPRKEQRRLRPAVVLDVALAAHEGATLLARGVGVRIERVAPITLAPARDARQVRDGRVAPRERRDAGGE